jgi:thymidylate synthase (FAD)
MANLEFEVREARLQDTKNRQNSIETSDTRLQEAWETVQDRVAETAESAYKWALDNGIAKEQARAVLPEGMTRSKMYMNGTLRSWAHYIKLRSGNGTQKEHRDIASACATVIATIFPMISEFISND